MPSEPLPSPWQHCFVRGASAESSTTRPFASTTGIWLVRRSSGWRSEGKSVGAAGAGGASGDGGGSGAVARASSLSMSYRHIPPTQYRPASQTRPPKSGPHKPLSSTHLGC